MAKTRESLATGYSEAMTEWRRTLKSWPKETVNLADLASLPGWVREVARERREARTRDGKAKFLAAFVLLLTFAFCLFLFLVPRNDPRILALLLGMFASLPLVLVLFGALEERLAQKRKWQELERLEALGETTLGGEFVGIAYADRNWRYPDFGWSVDEGVLRIDLGRLTYVGRHTRFDLPASAVVGTELRRYDPGTTERLRLYVEWIQGEERGTFSVALPYRRSMRRRFAEATALRERIERWRTEPFPHYGAPTPYLPTQFQPTKLPDRHSRIGRPAKLLAACSIFVALNILAVFVGLGLRLTGQVDDGDRLAGALGAGCCVAVSLWPLIATKIEAKLPEKYRCQPKKDDALRDALAKAEAASHESVSSDSGLKA